MLLGSLCIEHRTTPGDDGIKGWEKEGAALGEAVFDAEGHLVVLGALDEAILLEFFEGGGQHGMGDAAHPFEQVVVAGRSIQFEGTEDGYLPW